MSNDAQFSEALDYHRRGRPGKTEVRPTKPCSTQHDLSMAYTPGVAEPCLAIEKNPDDAFLYTNRGNLVAVVSNGTAVLGLGDIGPLGGKPVMEGKAVLFKRFADIDVFDIELATGDPDEIIRTCEILEPTFGGINLEDIKAPECFYIEETLKKKLDIPVFHDDQHGTAIIAGAGLLNACQITGRKLEDLKLVVSGAGAAGIACSRFMVQLGVAKENVILCDSKGVVHDGRDDLNPVKQQWVVKTKARSLADAMKGADVFLGVSVKDLVDEEMVKSMAKKPIIFALANPYPEITYEKAKEACPDAIVATGRSDYPNQVNNVLGFPFIFRGALDVRARGITEGMKVAAAQALAQLAQEDVPDSVLKAYSLDRLEFGPDYIIPKPFDPRVLWYVAPAIAKTATEEGVARVPLPDVQAYADSLQARFQASYNLMQAVRVRAQQKPKQVVFPDGADLRFLRAARRVVDENIGLPILLGGEEEIEKLAVERHISLAGIEVHDPSLNDGSHDELAEALFKLRARKGMTLVDARRALRDPNMHAAMMLQSGQADAVVGGLTNYYPETIRPALQVLPMAEGRTTVSAVYVCIIGQKPYLLADCAVNQDPDAEKLAEIALSTAEIARSLQIEPRVALLSYSNFGSARGPEAEKVREAVRICREKEPDLLLDGEMHADTAVVQELLEKRHPFNRLGRPANCLVFPNLTAANSAYKLLHRLGGAELIGPILNGLSKPVHVLQRDAEVGDIVNLTAIAVLDAQRRPARSA
jgi:malate dehydrogenase (oxaloacetate-decarboxylating)(NADP+)